jgi:hypothetical protein
VDQRLRWRRLDQLLPGHHRRRPHRRALHLHRALREPGRHEREEPSSLAARS